MVSVSQLGMQKAKYELVHEFPGGQIETAWRDLLSRLAIPSHYDAPEYFLEPFWVGKRPFAVLALVGGRAIAVATGIHRGGDMICGLPVRPQIAVSEETDKNAALEMLLKGLLEEARDAKTITVYSWPSLDLASFVEYGFSSRQMLGSVVLDLTLGAEALFQQFSKDRRRNIRFAEKNGVTVRLATGHQDFLRAYDVYLTWVDAKATKLKGQRRTFQKFESAQQLSNRKLFVAEHSGKVIAINTFRFYPSGLFESAANYSLEEFLHLKPNDLLQWGGIEWACKNGLRRHSLGGAHSFLVRFGGTTVPVIRYRLDRTFLHRHEFREKLEAAARKTLLRVPSSIQAKVRRRLDRAGG